MSRFKKLLLGTLAVSSPLFAAQLLHADEYQFEVNGVIGFAEEDNGPVNLDSDVLGVFGDFYFEPINTRGGPLAEAPFIQHASGASAYLLSKDYDRALGEDVDVQGVEARIVGNSGAYLNLALEQRDDGDDSADKLGVGVGIYLTDLSTIEGNFASISEEDGNQDFDVNIFSVAFKQLMLQQSPYVMSVGLNGDMRQSDAVDDDSISFAADLTLYPSDFLGLSVGFEHEDHDLYKRNDLLLAADYFIQPNLRVGAAYSFGTINPDNNSGDIDTNSLLFNAGVRF